MIVAGHGGRGQDGQEPEQAVPLEPEQPGPPGGRGGEPEMADDGPRPSGRRRPGPGRAGLRRTGEIHGKMDWNRWLRSTPERP